MNRRIKFRGKRKSNNKWTYGALISESKSSLDVYIEDYLGTQNVVDSETVGQFIGLYDKHSKEIYEGDLVTCNNSFNTLCVVWDIASSRPCWILVKPSEWNGDCYTYKHCVEFDNKTKYEVVGNIHDKQL